jgi:ABC-type transport system involved in cytochrome c biogenesis ATPase subunit
MSNLIEVNDRHFSNGCGKSTMLRHFGGQLHPLQGSVKFMGQPDAPISFQFPSKPYTEDLDIKA